VLFRNKKLWIVLALIAVMVVLAGCSPAMDTTTTADLKEGNVFKRYLVYPLSLSLDFIADTLWGQYGLSILVVTIVIRFLVLPLNLKQYKSTKAMQKLQPELANLKKKYKDDAKKQQEETMKLFQQNNVNPLAGCFPLIIQMPILFALYYAIVGNPDIRSHSFLWLELGEKDPFYILPILAAATTFIQQKVMSKYTPPNPQMNTIMMIFPVMIFVMSMSFPAAMPLYWVYGNIFTIVQTHFIYGRGSQEGGTSK
jgi:YidC/Oxa1 family membrane protein insertase